MWSMREHEQYDHLLPIQVSLSRPPFSVRATQLVTETLLVPTATDPFASSSSSLVTSTRCTRRNMSDTREESDAITSGGASRDQALNSDAGAEEVEPVLASQQHQDSASSSSSAHLVPLSDALLSPTPMRPSGHIFHSPLVSASSVTAAAAVRSPTLAHEHELSAIQFPDDQDDDLHDNADADDAEGTHTNLAWEEFQRQINDAAAQSHQEMKEGGASQEQSLFFPPAPAARSHEPAQAHSQSSHPHSHSHSALRSHASASESRRRIRRAARHRRGCGRFRGYGPDTSSPFSRSYDPLVGRVPQTRRAWQQFALHYLVKPLLFATTATLTSFAVGYLYHWSGAKHDARFNAAEAAHRTTADTQRSVV